MFNYKDIKGLNRLNKDQKFFVKSFLNLANELYKKGDKTLIDILKKEDLNAEKFLNDIGNVLLKHKITDEKMDLSLLESKMLTSQLDKKIEAIFNEEYKNENSLITKTLKQQIKDKYNVNNYLLSLGLNFTLNKIKSKDLKKILNHTIDGKNYSDRIYKNKNEVAKKMKVEVRKFLNGETNVNDIEKQIRNRFRVNKYNTQRLVNNEIARVQNASNEQFFVDNGGEDLLYSATLDTHTCANCGDYDGVTFKVNDSRPDLPLHTNCRCTYILIPDKDYRPSYRINNLSKLDIDYQTYSNWMDENGDALNG